MDGRRQKWQNLIVYLNKQKMLLCDYEGIAHNGKTQYRCRFLMIYN